MQEGINNVLTPWLLKQHSYVGCAVSKAVVCFLPGLIDFLQLDDVPAIMNQAPELIYNSSASAMILELARPIADIAKGDQISRSLMTSVQQMVLKLQAHSVDMHPDMFPGVQSSECR